MRALLSESEGGSLVEAVCAQVYSVAVGGFHLKHQNHTFEGLLLPPHNLYLTRVTLTQSSQDPSGFLLLYGAKRFARTSQAFRTAAPFRSEEAEAAVALVLGTVLVLVSEM